MLVPTESFEPMLCPPSGEVAVPIDPDASGEEVNSGDGKSNPPRIDRINTDKIIPRLKKPLLHFQKTNTAAATSRIPARYHNL